jgi:hypothetical protein
MDGSFNFEEALKDSAVNFTLLEKDDRYATDHNPTTSI